MSVTDNPDNEAKVDSSTRGTKESLEKAGSCYDKNLGTLSETDQLRVQGSKGLRGSSPCSSDVKLVQKFLFQAALLFSNLLFISSLTVSMASLDSFNRSQHLDSFVSLLSV